jgi:hypothetical protein
MILICALALKKYKGVAKAITSTFAILVRIGFASSFMQHSYFSIDWHFRQDVQPRDLYLRKAV